MSDILYERSLTSGPTVRIRRVTPAGVTPVRAVIEVDRRGGDSPRTSGGVHMPPPLMTVEGNSEADVIASLRPFADEDAAMARLMAQQGKR